MDEYYFDKVGLLLHADGADGSTIITDASSYHHVCDNYGTGAVIKTTDFKFGGSSFYFNGDSSIIRADTGSVCNLSSYDFTIELWVKIKGLTSALQGLVNKKRSYSSEQKGWGLSVSVSTYALIFWYGVGTLGYTIETGNNVITVDTWHHVAVCRKGNVLTFFVDGVNIKTVSFTATIASVTNSYPVYVGKDTPSAVKSCRGYIDDVRVTVGYSRYTDNFTPPSAAFPDGMTGFIAELLGNPAGGTPQLLSSQSVAQIQGDSGAGSPQAVSAHNVAQITGDAASGTPQTLLSHNVAQVIGNAALGQPSIYARTEILAYIYAEPMLQAPSAVATQQFVLIEGQGTLGTPSVFARHGYEFFQALDGLTVGATGTPSTVTGFFSIDGFTVDELLNSIASTRARDYIALKSPITPSVELVAAVQELLSHTDTVVTVVPLAAVANVLGFTDTAGVLLDRVLRLLEKVGFATKLTGTGELLLSAQTQARLADVTALHQTGALTELVTLTGTASAEIYYGAFALEQVLVQTGSSMLGEYSKTLKEFVTLLTANGFVSGLSLTDAFTLTEGPTPDYIRELAVSDQLVISAVQSVLAELVESLAEMWTGADQLQLVRVLGLSEELLVEAAVVTGARGMLSERLGLVEQARAVLELSAFLQEALTTQEATAFITALGLADTLTLQDQAVLDAVAQLLAREPLALVALVGAVQETGIRLSELIGVNSLAQFRAGFALLDELALTDTALLDLLKDWLLRENLGITTTTTPLVELAIRLAETVRLLERDAPVLWSKLSTGFSLEEASWFSLQYVLNVREQLVLTGAAPVVVELLTRLVELASFVDYTGTVEFLTASDQLSLQALLYNGLAARLSEQFDLTELGNAAGFFGLSLSTGLAVKDASQSWVELLAQAKTGLMFFGRMPLQEGDFTAWVFNTDTLGMTQYTNYAFNSMMLCENRLFGLTETGLYLLEGETDDGAAIDALIATGDLDFGVKIRKAVPRAYLYITKPGRLVLRTISYHYGQTQEHFYEITLRPEDVMGVHRLRLRREIRAEAWAFEIKNVDGGEFELQGAEVLPVLLTRRS